MFSKVEHSVVIRRYELLNLTQYSYRLLRPSPSTMLNIVMGADVSHETCLLLFESAKGFDYSRLLRMAAPISVKCACAIMRFAGARETDLNRVGSYVCAW